MPTNLNFPVDPVINQTHTEGLKTWYWTGNSWAFQRVSVPGKSAYQVALDNGFTGSEADWLASLQATVAQSTIDNILAAARAAATDASSGDVNAIQIAAAAAQAASAHTDLIFSQAQDIINSARYSGEAALESNANDQLQKIQAARSAAESALNDIFNANATSLAQVSLSANNAAQAAVTAGQTASAKADAAGQSATAAIGAATQAATSYSGAQQSASNAQTYAGQASSSSSNAQGSAAIALAKQGLAAQSATDAAYSASAANTSEQNAAASSNASGSFAQSANQSKITADTRAQDSANSALASATSSQLAQSNSTLAAQSASASQASQLVATIAATQLFPSTFDQTVYWTNSLSGQYPASTIQGTFVNDSQAGYVYQTNLATGTNLAAKGYQAVQSGRRYRVTARVRQSSPSTNSAANHVSIDLYGMDTSFSGVTKVSSPLVAVGTLGQAYDLTTTSWVIIGVEYTISNSETAQFLRPYLFIGGNLGSTVQVSYLKIEDTTESSRAGDSATAAVNTLATVNARATDVAQYAASALTSSTQASTNAGAAQTASGVASLAASTAQTAASQSSQSATTAAGSAALADQSSQLAVASKNAAGVSANAAALNATAAGSSATNAGLSAAAAQSYLVQAQLGSDLTYPSTFANGNTDYVLGGTASNQYLNVDGQQDLEFDDGLGIVNHKTARPLVLGRRYLMVAEARALTDTTQDTSLVISRLSTQGESGAGDYTVGEVSSLDGSHQTHTLLASEGWVTFACEYTAIAGDKPYIRSYLQVHAENSSVQIRTMAIRDITDVYYSGRSATAAASSAANAAVSQTAASQAATSSQQSATQAAVSAGNAGQSAAGANTSQTQASLAAQDAQGSASSASQSAGNATTAATLAGTKAQASTDSASFAASKANEANNSATSASGFATAAQTQAANALGSANSAATSSTTATSRASDAGNSATAATASALTASNQASNALTSATAANASAVAADASSSSAKTSSSISAQFSGGSLNSNPAFVRYSSGASAAVPDDWSNDNQTSGGALRVSGETQGYGVRLTSTANQISYTSQLTPRINPSSWWVLEADVLLNSGTFAAAGSMVSWGGTAMILNFSTDPDNTDTVVGPGTVGQTYRFRKLIQSGTGTSNAQASLYLINHSGNLGSMAVANSITWYRCAIRPATNSEIAAQRADNNSALAIAQINTESNTRVTADTALANRATALESTVNNPTNGNAALTSRIATEETTRANAVSSLATRATSLESRAVGGGNLLVNTDFLTTDGWVVNNAQNVTANSGVNLNGVFPPGENDLGLYQGSRSNVTGAFLEWQSSMVSVVPGSYIQAFVFSAAARCDGATMVLCWYDGSGNVISSQAATTDPGTGSNGASPAGYNQQGITSVVVPQSAIQASLNLRKFNTSSGQTDSYAWFWRPYLGIAAAGQTAFSNYSPGGARANLSATTARIATEETTRASAVGALATRATNLESRSGSNGALNTNATFFNYSNTSGPPASWITGDVLNPTYISRAAGELSLGYGMRAQIPAGAQSYSATALSSGSVAANGWYVIEADVLKNSGSLLGSGVLLRTNYGSNTQDVSLTLSTDLDITGTAPGPGVNGKIYRFRKLVQVTLPNADSGNLYLMSHWTGLGDVSNAIDITWYRCAVRPASAPEVAANKAAQDIVTTVARIATEENTRATADSALATRTSTLESQFTGTTPSFINSRIATEETTRSSADSTLANRATTLESQFAGTTGSAIQTRIATEESTRATADSSLATRASTLESQFAGTTASQIQSRIATEETTRSSADATLASRASTLESQISGAAGSALLSRIATEESTRASADSTQATQYAALSSSFSTANQLALTNLPAQITTQTWGDLSITSFGQDPRTQPDITKATNVNDSIIGQGIEVTVASSALPQTKWMVPLVAGRTYQVVLTMRNVSGTTPGSAQMLVNGRDSSGGYTGQSSISFYGIVGTGLINVVATISCDTYIGYWSTARYVNIMFTPNGASNDVVYRLGRLAVTDITAITATNASIANEATTRTSADSALASRATTLESQFAGTTASAIQSRIATEESTRSTADGALASRSSVLESQSRTDTALTINPSWSNYPTATGVPPGASGYYSGSSGTFSRATLPNGYYALQMDFTAGDGGPTGIETSTPGITALGWYVLEVTVRLDIGNFSAIGIRYGFFDDVTSTYNPINQPFSTLADASGTAPGDGAVGRTYNFNVLIQATNLTQLKFFTGLYRWGAFGGSGSSATRIVVSRQTIRPATEGEIRAKRADSNATQALANITNEATTRASMDSGLASQITSLTTTVNGNTSNITTNANTLSTTNQTVSNLSTTVSSNYTSTNAAILAVKKNQAPIAWWKAGATLAWNTNGGAANSIYTLPDNVAANAGIKAPDGSTGDVWLAQADNSGGAAGGWDQAPISALDPDRTYRFIVPIAQLGTLVGRAAYWGTANVCDLNTTNISGNPYFANTTNLTLNRWHLFVGFIFPRNSTGKTNDGSGIWDTVTGQRLQSGLNFCFAPDGRQPTHRAYQYYSVNGAYQAFGRPLIELVDGSESNFIAALNNAAGVVAANASITNEATTRTSADSALASRASTLESQMAGSTGSFINSRIATEETTRSTADATLASRATALESQFAGTTGSAIQSRIATEETTRATADSTLASRSSSLESRTTTGNSLFANPDFSAWATSQLPNGWIVWSNPAGLAFVNANDPNKSGVKILQMTTNSGNDMGLQLPNAVYLQAGVYYVVEARAYLESGSWQGSGLYSPFPNFGSFNFASTPDTSGVVSSTQTGQRSWSAIFQSTGGGSNVYAMGNWSGWSGGNSAKTIDFQYIGLRTASVAEVNAQTVFTTTLPSTIARIATEETTRSSADSALASRATTLESQIAGNTSSFINSRIATEETTRSSADLALSTRSTVIEANFNKPVDFSLKGLNYSQTPWVGANSQLPDSLFVSNGANSYKLSTTSAIAVGYRSPLPVAKTIYRYQTMIRSVGADGTYSSDFELSNDLGGAQYGSFGGYTALPVSAGWITIDYLIDLTTSTYLWLNAHVRLVPGSGGTMECAYMRCLDVTNQQANVVTTARIATEETTRANATSSLATQISTVTTNYQNADSQLQTNITNATNSLSNATSAVASRTSSIESNYGSTGIYLNGNSSFVSWPTGQNLPTGWNYWAQTTSGMTSKTVGSFTPNQNSVRFTQPAGTNVGMQEVLYMSTGWYVVEASVWLSAGNYAGAGVYIDNWGSALDFGNDPDNAQYQGTGNPGIRRFSKLYQSTQAQTVNIYAMANWNGFPSYNGSATKTIDFFNCSVRPASDAEIKAQTAFSTTLPALTTRVATTESAISTNQQAIAQRTQILEATVSTYINPNPTFAVAGYTGGPNTAPPYWGMWASNNGSTVSADGSHPNLNGNNSVHMNRQGASNVGILQYITNVPAGYYVVEADLEMYSGRWQGTGVYVQRQSDGATFGAINMGIDPDINNFVYNSTDYSRRQFSKLIVIGSQSNINFYAMGGWDGFQLDGSGSDTFWHKCALRPASDAEIKAQRVIDANLIARVTTNEGAITGVQGRTSAYWQTTAVAGNNRAQLSIHADANGGAGVDIVGDVTISGSVVVANTLPANTSTFAARNVQVNGLDFHYDAPSNSLVWGHGDVTYINDAGNGNDGFSLAPGSRGFTSGVMYIWINRNNSQVYVDNTNNPGNPNDYQIGRWYGGTNINITYGRTLITGDRVVTGSLDASLVTAGTITTDRLVDHSVTASVAITQPNNLTGDGNGGNYTPAGGGQSGTSGGGTYCPEADTPVLMANGTWKLAGHLVIGDMVRTQHELTMEWGDFMVIRARTFEAQLWAADDYFAATEGHPFYINGQWIKMRDIGRPSHQGLAVSIEVQDAHTFITQMRHGGTVINHNKTQNQIQ